MDYQTFNSQQHSFNGPYSTLPGAPTHSPQGGHVNNTDPTARFQSSPSPFPNGQGGGFPINMGGGSSGAMMQPGGGLSHNQLHQARAALQHQQQQQHQQWQQQQQQQQQHLQSPSPYGNPSFSQSLASPAHQQFAQNRQTISPSSANSNVPSYATPQNPQPSPGLVPSHNQQQSMAAPSIKPEPASQSMQVQTPVKAVPQSPVSPTAQARDQERMATLLEINTLLIKEAMGLQKEGKSGQIGQAPSQDGKPDVEKQAPTKEYLELMRRLQSNLAFLAQNAEKTHKPNQPLQPGPAIMAAPSAPAELVKLYIKLQGLFPGWKGQTMPMKASPGPQRTPSTTQPNSAGVQSSMQPPNSAGLMNPNNAIKQEQQQQTSTPPQNTQS